MTDETWLLVDRVPPLERDDVHVWRTRLACHDALVERSESTLSKEEIARANRFHQSRDRCHYVVGRGCLRWLLGEYLSMAPADVRLNATALGKPYLIGDETGLRFNVAHSDELALFAFARGREVGIDVEREWSDVNWRELAERNFAPEERAALLSAAAPSDPRKAFFRCWTRKEAYVKALGQGMQVPLDGFAVTIAAESAALIHTAHDPAQQSRWSLASLSPAAGFAAALAVEGHNCGLLCARHSDFP